MNTDGGAFYDGALIGRGKPFHEAWKLGDRFGIGLHFPTQTLFFTFNGQILSIRSPISSSLLASNSLTFASHPSYSLPASYYYHLPSLHMWLLSRFWKVVTPFFRRGVPSWWLPICPLPYDRFLQSRSWRLYFSHIHRFHFRYFGLPIGEENSGSAYRRSTPIRALLSCLYALWFFYLFSYFTFFFGWFSWDYDVNWA